MRIAIGSDHAGYDAKSAVAQRLRAMGHEVLDVGTHNSDSVDYPAYAQKVSAAITSGEADRGILICGSGIGVCIAANKIPGIRAGYGFNETSARLAREHNHAQILCLGARLLELPVLQQAVEAFLSAEYEGGRHDRRIDMIHRLETNGDVGAGG